MKKNLNYYGLVKPNSNWHKVILTMKISAFLLFCCIVNIFASPTYSQSTKISLNLNDVTIEEALNKIEKESEFYFLYNQKLIDVTRKVSIEADNEPIAEILDDIFGGAVKFVVIDRQIVLTPSDLKSPSAEMQQPGITGTVTDDKGTPLPGVNVTVKGTSTGVITDANGKYKINVPDENSILVYSFIGYTSQEITVSYNRIIDVKLSEALTALSEVVVTALGFKEDRDKVGSSTSQIKSDIIEASGEVGLLNKLAGRASGVFISKSSGSDPGGASFVQIRGANTLSGDIQPLYIIDGVPMSSSVIGGTSYSGVIQESRANDINPEDIASIQILKGASAAALWGSRASNGVIVITTKSGSFNEKMKISFKSTYSLDKINRYQKKQTTYGQGTGGTFNPTSVGAWGDKISARAGGEDEVDMTGQYFEGYQTGSDYYPIIKKNSKANFADKQYDEIFQNGHSIDNDLNISGGGANSNYMFSVSDVYQNGIFKSSSNYRRSTIRLNIESKLGNIIKLSTSTTYAITSSDRVQRSNNVAGTMLGYYRMPVDFDITDYIGNYYSSQTSAPIVNRQRSYRNYLGGTNPVYNNTLWTIYEQKNPDDVNRFINSTQITITPVEWFEFITRGGVDNYSDKRSTYFPVFSAGFLNGTFDEQIISENQLNLDVIARAKHDFGNFSSILTVGFNLNDRKLTILEGNMTSFLIADGPLNFSNAQSINKNPINSKTNIRSSRGYSLLGLTAYNSIFLNLSYAAEAASTFGQSSNSIFYYPSGDIAWQFSKLAVFKDSHILSFGKFRLAYGVVGVQPQPYKTSTLYLAGNSLFGNGAYLQSSNLGNKLLKPEIKNEYETGFDLRFLNDRLSTSVTYYQNFVKDMLLNVPIAPTTGFGSIYKNIGKMQNKGLELDFGYNIIRKTDLSVSMNANFTRNRNLVTDLAGASSVQVGGIGGFMANYAVEGEPVGIFMGGRYARGDDGKILFDVNGYPKVDASIGRIGDPNPKWEGGFGAEAVYKNFSLSMTFQTFQGGDFYDGTRSVMYTYGTHVDVGNEITTTTDLTNFAGKLIPAGTTVRGNIVDFGAGPVLCDESWYTSQGGGMGSCKEQFVVDGSWTRLRDISLSYVLRTESFRRVTKLQSMEFRISGRNLILWSGLKGVDPDLNQTQVTLGRGVDYFENPGTRSYLFSILINY